MGTIARVNKMTRRETLFKISHYEWMLESLTLKPAHEAWIRIQIDELTDSLAQFHEKV